MRLIADGVVDREGVAGLARRLGYTERHLHRRLVDELGAGPLAAGACPARADRARAARDHRPADHRRRVRRRLRAACASSTTRSARCSRADPERAARAARRAGGRARARGRRRRSRCGCRTGRRSTPRACSRSSAPAPCPGVEERPTASYRRSLRLPHGAGTRRAARRPTGTCRLQLRLDDLRDLAAAVQRCRRLLDLDADPQAVADALGADPLLGAARREAPGRRVPGHVDGAELARARRARPAGLGGRRAHAGRAAGRPSCGEPLEAPLGGGRPTLFPTAAAVAGADPEALADARAAALRALRGLAAALADGELVLDPGADRAEAERRLLALPGHRAVDRRATSRCARCATPTRSSPPTSACGTRSSGSAATASRAAASAAARGAGAPTARTRQPWHLWAQLARQRADRHLDTPLGPLDRRAAARRRRRPALTRVRSPAATVSIASARAARDAACLPTPARQLAEYFAGERTAFDLPLSAGGTPFQQRVWGALREIPYGETISYGELAAAIGPPGAAPRGRARERAQPDRDRRALPPRGRRGRAAHRLRRRAGAQAGVADAGAAARLVSSTRRAS